MIVAHEILVKIACATNGIEYREWTSKKDRVFGFFFVHNGQPYEITQKDVDDAEMRRLVQETLADNLIDFWRLITNDADPCDPSSLS